MSKESYPNGTRQYLYLLLELYDASDLKNEVNFINIGQSKDQMTFILAIMWFTVVMCVIQTRFRWPEAYIFGHKYIFDTKYQSSNFRIVFYKLVLHAAVQCFIGCRHFGENSKNDVIIVIEYWFNQPKCELFWL